MKYYFVVHGRPVPQGSLRAFKAKSGAVVTPQQPKVLKWRGDVRSALEATAGGIEPSSDAFTVQAGFYFRRPKSHLNSKGVAKLSAPLWHTQSPDVDKLLRSVLDALTGVVWHDDKQVVTVRGDKFWSGWDHATIRITTISLGDSDELPDRG